MTKRRSIKELSMKERLENAFLGMKLGFKKYAVFSGRASVVEYLSFFVMCALFSYLFSWIGQLLSQDMPGLLPTIWTLATLLPMTALQVRRLHDINKSGWWVLLPLTLIGIFPFIYFMFKKGDPDANRFGEPSDVL